MKAIILSRVSTNEQQDGHSIEAQKARLREYCKRKSLEVIK
jgi:DNA invertase Pin-like site-specific DNA recombinase